MGRDLRLVGFCSGKDSLVGGFSCGKGYSMGWVHWWEGFSDGKGYSMGIEFSNEKGTGIK